MADWQYVRIEIDDRVAVLTIDHPPVNSFNGHVLRELEEAVDQLVANEDVKVVIITGGGTNAFVPGADISEIRALFDQPEDSYRAARGFIHAGQALFLRIERASVPFIAAINGYCLAGGLELAREVIKASNQKAKLRYLYPVDMKLMNKIERVAKSMYGASEVKYSDQASQSITRLEKAGIDKLPVCMAKTHLSLSSNPKKKGRPRGFKLNVEDVEVAAGAGYVVVKCEGVNTMPGLPKVPRGAAIDVDVKTGETKGLF